MLNMNFRLFFVSFISSVSFVLCSIPVSNYTEYPSNSTQNASESLNMTVFYESLCPDSVNFFKEQFSSNWLPFYDYLNITLVPYGHASQKQDKTGKWTFICQHGEKECQGNRIQSCAIARLYERQREKLFDFISCYMSHTDKDQYGPKCADSYNISFRRLKKCAVNSEGSKLLAKYGDITHEFKPTISWIPTIVFNDVSKLENLIGTVQRYNETENNLASSNLKSLLCQKLNNLPKACIQQ